MLLKKGDSRIEEIQEMSGRLKKYCVGILAIIVVTMVLGPALACASRLPTACNLFDKKEIPKPGACKYRLVCSDQRILETELAISYAMSVQEIKEILWNNHQNLTALIPFEGISIFSPLRC